MKKFTELFWLTLAIIVMCSLMYIIAGVLNQDTADKVIDMMGTLVAICLGYYIGKIGK